MSPSETAPAQAPAVEPSARPGGPGVWEAAALGLLVGARWRGFDIPLAVAAFVVGVVGLLRLRHPVGVIVAAGLAGAALAAGTAQLQTAAMLRRPERIDAVGIVGGDPDVRGATATSVVRFAGRRLRIQVPASAASLLELGAHVHVRGVAAPVGGNPAALQRAFDDRIAGVVAHARVRVVSSPPPPVAVPSAMRAWLEAAVLRGCTGETAGLSLGLLLGDGSRLSDADRVAFRTAGLSHLLVASGSNLAFVLGAVGAVLARSPAGRRSRLIAAAAAALVYVAMTRFEPSIVRAGVMAAIGIGAAWVGIARDPRRAVAIAVCVLVACDPFLACRIGFVLSVAASAAIVWWARPLAERLAPWFGRRGGDAVAVSLVAQAAVAPVIAAATGRVSLVGLLANLPALPLAGFMTVLLVALAPVAAVVPQAYAAANPGLRLLLGLGRLAAEVPGAQVIVPRGVGVGACVVAVALVAVGLARRSGRIRWRDRPQRYARAP